jgi:hypothetical protein
MCIQQETSDQQQEEWMFGREKRAAARAEAARKAEADALFAEADRWADLAGEPRDFQQEITRERAARIMQQLGEPLAQDARAAAAEPVLTGTECDAEIDRLAELYPEPEAPGSGPWNQLKASSDTAQAARQREHAAAAAQRIALGAQREHPGPHASAAVTSAGRELRQARQYTRLRTPMRTTLPRGCSRPGRRRTLYLGSLSPPTRRRWRPKPGACPMAPRTPTQSWPHAAGRHEAPCTSGNRRPR